MKKLKKSKIRDPKRPKKYLSPFIHFFLAKRQVLREKHPTWTQAHIVKECAAMWRKYPPKLKKKYEVKAEFGKQLYKRQMTRYTKPSQEDLNHLYGTRPKFPAGPYAQFIKEHFSEYQRIHPRANFKETNRGLAKQWKSLSKKRRVRYDHLYLDDWRRWKREQHLYDEGHFHGSNCSRHKPKSIHHKVKARVRLRRQRRRHRRRH